MRELLIAHEDLNSGKRIADQFTNEGYSAHVTDSLASALEVLLKRQIKVLLLSSELKDIGLNESISLLKQCDRNLIIILVGDELPLPHIRKAREEGIYYHALKPVSKEDWEEIRQVVKCAFRRQKSALHHNSSEKEEKMKTMKTLAPALLVLLAVTSPALAVDTAVTYKSGYLVLAFVAICALIVVAQLLPALRELLRSIKGAAKASNAKAAPAKQGRKF